MHIPSGVIPLALASTLGAQAASQHVLHSGQRPLHGQSGSTGELKVAIIGAGAAGTSAAFWLSKAKSRLGENVTVTIFEKSDYVGGRSTTVMPYDDPTVKPIEIGGSVFVSANKNLVRAVKEYNLSVTDFGEEAEETGIWDGQQFVLTMSDGGWKKWWQTVKLLWRYGYYSPTRAQTLMKNMIGAYLGLYEPHVPHSSIADISASLNFTSLTSVSASDYLAANGVNSLFTHELVDAATRVNYGQNVDDIHALEGMVSLAANGAQSVIGGNWQIFDLWAKKSGADVHLNTAVKTLRQGANGKWHVGIEGGSEEKYDIVVLAAPYKSTGIHIDSPELNIEEAFPKVDYVHLHVTLVATTAPHPQASYFFPDAKPDTPMPETILTTSSGPVIPEFNSLSYHEKIERSGHPAERIVKIFSKARVEDEWMDKVFGVGKVGWVHRKEWDAYPVLPPTTSFPAVKPAPGLYYVNAFEPFISTMETETIASLNVVDLLLQDHYGRGICGQKKGEKHEPSTPAADFVWGWDC